MDKARLKTVIESLIFSTNSALTVERIAGVIEGVDKNSIREAIKELSDEHRNGQRGILIEEAGGGFLFRTNPECAPWIRRLLKLSGQRLSKAAMECLAIIAYKQPLTKAEIEAIRGVDSTQVLSTLLEKRFTKIVGRKDAPGRPSVYGTTREFLETFDLKDLSCLPSLKDIERMEVEDGEARGEGPGEGAEDNSPIGHDVETEGRGTDNRGPGEGEQEGGGAGGQGQSSA